MPLPGDPMFRNKRFRSALCILLSFLTLVHTTPLYAAVEVGEVTQSGELQPSGSSPQDPGAQPETPESPDSPESPGEMPSAASEENPNDKGNDIAQQAPDSNLSTGAAGYSVPLATPPGRQGIAPNLSLTYNSYRQSGWIGPGFGLDIGSIQRSTKRGLNYTANDYVRTSLTSLMTENSTCMRSNIPGMPQRRFRQTA